MTMPKSTQPTIDQLLNLADRAEHKGGLNAAEADRLRRGLANLGAALALAEERVDHYKALSEQHRRRVLRLKQLRPNRHAVAATPPSVVEDARLARLAEMAHRWLLIPQRHQAGSSVLAIVNDRPGVKRRAGAPEALSARVSPADAAPRLTPQLAPVSPPHARTAPKETRP